MIDRINFNPQILIYGILIIAGVLLFATPLFVFYKWHSNKKKYPFKIIMNIRRNNGWIVATKLKGGIVKDERGVSMFKIPYSWGKSYETREIPPSDIISSDGTIQMARIGETMIFLNPKIHISIRQNPKTGEEIIEMDSDGNGNKINLVPVTTQTKYSTLYEMKRAAQLANAGKIDWKPVMAYGGLILLFAGVIIVTYIIWERIDISAIQQLTEINKEIAQVNLEIVEKLRGIQ